MNLSWTSLFMRYDFLIPPQHLALASGDIGVHRVEILNFFLGKLTFNS